MESVCRSVTTTPKDLDAGGKILATAFLISGVLHLVRPGVFEPIVPRCLPAHRELVLVSGVAELACGAGLLHPRTRRVAGLASVAVLAGVFPANLQMSVDQIAKARKTGRASDIGIAAATLARLPLQWPLIKSALRAAGR